MPNTRQCTGISTPPLCQIPYTKLYVPSVDITKQATVYQHTPAHISTHHEQERLISQESSAIYSNSGQQSSHPAPTAIFTPRSNHTFVFKCLSIINSLSFPFRFLAVYYLHSLQHLLCFPIASGEICEMFSVFFS
jgi:hypothetical protein